MRRWRACWGPSLPGRPRLMSLSMIASSFLSSLLTLRDLTNLACQTTMDESPPPQNAPAAGADVNMVPEHEGQAPPPAVDSINPSTTSPQVTTVDEKTAKPTSDGDTTGFLSTALASLLQSERRARSSTPGPPDTPIPVSPEGRRTTDDENGKHVPEVPEKVMF